MGIVADTLTENCDSLVDEILSLGGRAVGMHPKAQNVLLGERITLSGEDGEPVDLGRVGHVSSINRDTLTTICRSGAIPVIPSLALDREGGLLNVNADTAAADVARLLPAEKLVFLSDVPGIMRDRNDTKTLISHLSVTEVDDLIATGIIESGMVPKVEAALAALKAGCRKVHIIDGRIPHAILLEVYFDKGIGTEIVR
jgi:acetylglutamate kinase